MLELLALQYSQSSPLIDVFVSCSVIEYEILNLPILLLNFHLKIISYFWSTIVRYVLIHQNFIFLVKWHFPLVTAYL